VGGNGSRSPSITLPLAAAGHRELELKQGDVPGVAFALIADPQGHVVGLTKQG